MPLDFASPVPLYHQLYLELKAGLENGMFYSGQKLPSEPELSEKYGIGRPTVRQALEALLREGWIEKRRGSGTYVREKPQEADLFSLGGTTSAFEREGIDIRKEVIEPVTVCKGVEGGEAPLSLPHYRFSRLFSDPEGPVLFERFYLERSAFPDFERYDFAAEALSTMLQRVYRMRPESGHQTFQVLNPPQEVGKYLEVPSRSAVLLVRRKLRFPGHADVFLSELYCRTDRYHFSQELPGPFDRLRDR